MEHFQELLQDPCTVRSAITYLKQFITEARFQRMRTVAQYRTRFITVVLEDIYQPQNASAVLRTCDALGIQDVHILQIRNTFSVSRGVSLGSEQWLTLHKYSGISTQTLLNQLRARGYLNIATTANASLSLETFRPRQPVALWIGNELHGLSEECLQHADLHLRIPMWGFVQSYNLSVATAIILYTWISWIRQNLPPETYTLTRQEQDELLLHWLMNTIPNAHALLNQWWETKKRF